MFNSVARIATRLAGGTVFSCAAFILGITSSSADEAIDPTTGMKPRWQFYMPAYLWAAGANGTARTLPPLPESEVDISFSDSIDALKDLDGGIIATVFAHNDRLLLMADINWMRLSPEQSINLGPQQLKLSLFSETFTFLSAVGYRLVDEGDLTVDAYVGAKLWYMDNSASVKPELFATNSVEKQETWVDGVVGGQFRTKVADRVFVNAIGFVGAGGSDFYGDIYGGVTYQLNDKWDVFAGYRAMQVERQDGSFSYDVTQQGPLFGFAAKF